MRLLIWHVDAFVAEPTERGRSPVADAEPRTVRVDEALVVFAAAEKADEPEPEAAAGRAARAIVDVAQRLGAREIVLHSFAHLFVELSSPTVAKQILDETERLLQADGYIVSQSAFGWANILAENCNAASVARLAHDLRAWLAAA
jgi:threonyl-tRNA synthetase